MGGAFSGEANRSITFAFDHLDGRLYRMQEISKDTLREATGALES